MEIVGQRFYLDTQRHAEAGMVNPVGISDYQVLCQEVNFSRHEIESLEVKYESLGIEPGESRAYQDLLRVLDAKEDLIRSIGVGACDKLAEYYGPILVKEVEKFLENESRE